MLGGSKVSVPRWLVEFFGSEEEALEEALRLAEIVYLPLIEKIKSIKGVVGDVGSERDLTEAESKEEIVKGLKETRRRIYKKWVEE